MKIVAFLFILNSRQLRTSVWTLFFHGPDFSSSHPECGLYCILKANQTLQQKIWSLWSVFLHLLVRRVYDLKSLLKSKHLLKCMCSVFLKSKRKKSSPDCIWKLTECMECAVALTSFFDYTSAEFRKARNFNLIQTCSDWYTSRGSLVFILAADKFGFGLVFFFACADVFLSVWELQFKLRIKMQRCHILQVEV